VKRPTRFNTLCACAIIVFFAVADWLTDCCTEGEPPLLRRHLRWFLGWLLIGFVVCFTLLHWRFP
jgi:hypothetical protein